MTRAEGADNPGVGTARRRAHANRAASSAGTLPASELSESTQKLARYALSNAAANAAAGGGAVSTSRTPQQLLRPPAVPITPGPPSPPTARPMAIKSTSTQTLMSTKSVTTPPRKSQSGLIPLAPAPPGCHGFQPIKPKASAPTNAHSSSNVVLPRFSASVGSGSKGLSLGDTANGIKLTTRKNWVLPPRPKTKKICKRTTAPAAGVSPAAASPPAIACAKTKPKDTKHSKQRKSTAGLKSIKSIDVDNTTGKVLINSQIHSNINLLTNDPNELKHQFENVKSENDSLKKILRKLNKEIDNLMIQSSTPSPTSEAMQDGSSSRGTSKMFGFGIGAATPHSPETDSSSTGTVHNVKLNETTHPVLNSPDIPDYVDPMNLSYHMGRKGNTIKGKLSKTSAGLAPPEQSFNLSPSDIMINPSKITKRRKRTKASPTPTEDIFTPPPTAITDLTVGMDLEAISLDEDLMHIIDFDEPKAREMLHEDSKNSTIGSLITPSNSGSTTGTQLLDTNLLEFDLFSHTNAPMTNDPKEVKDDLIIY